jgi:hypothetical protein
VGERKGFIERKVPGEVDEEKANGRGRWRAPEKQPEGSRNRSMKRQ